MMDSPQLFQEVLKTLGPSGVLAGVLWYLLTRTIPRMQDRQDSKLETLSSQMATGFQALLQATNQNIMAMRFLIATQTKADYQSADMKVLICPHDGKPCVDPHKQKEYKESLDGRADQGGVQTPTPDPATAGTGGAPRPG